MILFDIFIRSIYKERKKIDTKLKNSWFKSFNNVQSLLA